MLSKGKVKLAQGLAWILGRKGVRKNVETLNEALALEALCGCGIDCDCFGFLTLPSWNSTTGESEYVAIYVIDGNIVVNDVETAKAEINAIKALNE